MFYRPEPLPLTLALTLTPTLTRSSIPYEPPTLTPSTRSSRGYSRSCCSSSSPRTRSGEGVGVGVVLGLGLANPRPRLHPHPHPHPVQLTSAPDAADPTATTASVGAAVVESTPGGASEDGSGATAAAQGPQLSSLP